MQTFVVNLLMHKPAVLVEFFAVIGGKNDDGILQQIRFLQCPQQRLHQPFIHKPDLTVVESDELLDSFDTLDVILIAGGSGVGALLLGVVVGALAL